VVKNHPGDIIEKIKAYQIGSDESEGEESNENGEK
jgi:hypothetical protein